MPLLQIQSLQRRNNSLVVAQEQRAVLQSMPAATTQPFSAAIGAHLPDGLKRESIRAIQVNLGKLCNQTCAHCHVDAGPDRREIMTSDTIDEVIDFLKRSRVETLDVTGGAPEMNPHFRRLIVAARELGKNVIDRSNLTILMANGFQDLPEFLAAQQVHIIASLPCYLEDNCDAQRGQGVFRQSIAAISRLNALGYGQPKSELQLDLVYNPQGIALPPEQSTLEQAYKEQLHNRYGITFNRLLTITNMPVSRFLDELVVNKRFESYMQKLIDHFNPSTLAGVMCRTLVSVDWQGYLFDCDFNQMLDLPLRDSHRRIHVRQATDTMIENLAITTGNHCFGCTAGCGSSCSGALMS